MTSYRQSMKDTLELMNLMREASLLERDLTPDEEKRREEIAKDLPDDDFKKRYGDKWMSVKMATATKMMKKEEVDLDEAKMKDLVIKGQDLETYAKKSGGIDKNDMMKVAAMLKRGDKSGAVKYAMKLDTDPKEYILNLIGEEVDLDEAKMSASQIAALKKAYEPMRGKKMSMDSGNKLRSIMDKIDDDKQALIQLVKADIPFVSALAVTRLISKHDMKGAEINKLKEEVDLDEGKMGDQWQKGAKSVKSGPFELMRGKSGVHAIMQNGKKLGDFSYDDEADNFVANMKGMKGQWVGNDIDSLFTHLQKVHKEEVEIEEASAAADARRAMRRDPDMKQRAFSKDDSATDDDKKAASKNIMMQMRKAQSLNGKFDVEFQDGKKIKIPAKMAIAVQQKYNSMRKPSDKEAFQAKVGKSYRDMLNALKEAVSPAQQAAIAISKKERGEKPKKESVLDRIDRKIKENKNG